MSRVEKAKPSYLDRLKEKDVPKEESVVKEEEAPQPPSSDSLMIRKTKRTGGEIGSRAEQSDSSAERRRGRHPRVYTKVVSSCTLHF